MSEENEKGKGGLKPGSMLQHGRYRIIRYISQGGFGCTYEAEHVMFGERVAIKELFVKEYCNRDSETGLVSVGVSSKQEMIGRLHRKFIDEARAQRSMSHPNIVRVIDVFEENSTAYYVMDYIDGQSLDALLNERNAPLSEQEAVGYIRQVAYALAYVHYNRRLHLDIKPGNIMIDRSGKAILIDFGASKQYDEQDSNNSTITGFTRGYAPLEQIGGHITTFSPATDIFSLGSTLYRLLTGELPADCIARSTGTALKPLPGSISESTRRAVEKSMNVIPNQRPQSIADFLSLLDAPVATAPAPAAPAPAPAAPEVTEINPTPSIPDQNVIYSNISIDDPTPNPQPDPTKKQRPLLLTIWLWAIILFNGYLLCMAIIIFNDQYGDPYFDVDLILFGTTYSDYMVKSVVTFICLVINIIAVVAIMKWKWRGFWILLISNICLLSAIRNYNFFMYMYVSIMIAVPVYMLVLFGLLLIKKNGKSTWRQLR